MFLFCEETFEFKGKNNRVLKFNETYAYNDHNLGRNETDYEL